MLFPHIVVAVAGSVLINLHFVNNQDVPPAEEKEVADVVEAGTEVEPGEEQDTTPEDKHTFVALIDVQFTDGSKRSCTGTLIHDTVVVTAAHCFVDCNNDFIMPELTLSFVVIGTKNMFDAGYEKYLPIERIVTHPRFEGWTADVALVYTFAGMTSDKPGKVIPISGEKSNTPVDSNVTVLSWGKCPKNNNYDRKLKNKKGLRQETSSEWRARPVQRKKQGFFGAKEEDKEEIVHYPFQEHSDEEKENDEIVDVDDEPVFKSFTTKRSRYLTSSEIRLAGGHMLPSLKHAKPPHEASSTRTRSKARRTTKRTKATTTRPKIKPKGKRTTGRRRSTVQFRNSLKSYENWRRNMGNSQNELMVEVFGFVSVQACKKLVERVMPTMYNFKNSDEILCYTSEDHIITKDDSGAPAIQQGHLVAVTVGGVEAGGEHVAIGMKMACFCAWILENLPDNSETEIKCCKNCCDSVVEKEQKQVQRAKLRKKKASRFADNDDYDSIEYTLMKEALKNRRILNAT